MRLVSGAEGRLHDCVARGALKGGGALKGESGRR